MIKQSLRSKIITWLYQDNIKEFLYEEYISEDNIRRIRTFIILNDMFHTIINLDKYGVYNEEKINYIESNNYKNVDLEIKRLRIRK